MELPYAMQDMHKLYIRKAYTKIFEELAQRIDGGSKSFAISGTPGIGKSVFFIYLLYRIMFDSEWKPETIVYHYGTDIYVYDMVTLRVSDIIRTDAKKLL